MEGGGKSKHGRVGNFCSDMGA